MAKTELGSFDTGNKTYKLVYRLGYGKYKDVVYIGNATYGNFIRFHKDEEEIVYLFIPRTKDFKISMKKDMYGYEVKDNRSFGVLGLHFPKSHNDLRQMLEMIFIPRGWKLTKLNFESRESMMKELFKRLVVERLYGKERQI